MTVCVTPGKITVEELKAIMSEPNDLNAVADCIKKNNIRFVQIGLTDLNGVLRGKCMSVSKFMHALESGMGFCDVVVATDIDDQLCDGLSTTGWQTGYPDAAIRLLPETLRMHPGMPDTLFVLTQFDKRDNTLCPRSLLQKVVERASNMGFAVVGSLEFEFTVFAETIAQMHTKQFRHLQTMTPGNCGYSVLRGAAYSDFYYGLLDLCETMDMSLEGLHTEIGPGVLEAAIAYDDVLRAGDKAILFKTFTKVFAQQRNCLATFMAKWDIAHQGQSGHTHLSLRDKHDASVFYDASKPNNMSDVMRHFLAGQQQCMPELLAMVAPTINSYARLVPGFWAPTQATWGLDNRTCALRVIAGSERGQRIEYRVPGADVNPYLALAVALASGLYGIENQLEPTSPISGNAYDVDLCAKLKLPTNLYDASQRLRQSDMARQYFGDQFIDDYATTREHEARVYAKQVTDWQLARYIESA